MAAYENSWNSYNTKMRTWKEIYQKEIDISDGPKIFFKQKIKEKQPLIKEIIKLSNYNGRILEAGCGTGVISTHLSSLNYDVTAIDIDKDMLDLAKQFTKFTKSSPKFKRQNLFNLKYPKDFFDIVFSHGILEHFSDKTIINIVNNELKISKKVLISIPSDYYKEKDKIYGDERFMSVKKWESILNKTQGKILRKIGYYFQSKFTFTLNKLIPKVMIYHAPYITFILGKKTKRIS